MEFTTGFAWIKRPIWTAALLLGSVLAAQAQTVPAQAPAAPNLAGQDSIAKDSNSQNATDQNATDKDSTAKDSDPQASTDKALTNKASINKVSTDTRATIIPSSAAQDAENEEAEDQDSADQDSADQGSTDEPNQVEPVTAEDGDVLKGIDIDKLDWSQLDIDAFALVDEPAAKKQAAKGAADDGQLNWSSSTQANGTSVAVKRSVVPFWNTRVGADMTVAREPTTMSELLAQKATNGGNVPQSSGSAWVAATAPGAGSIWDKTEVEARVDPGADQSKVGATLTKSVPMKNYSVTFQNGYNVTEQSLSPIPGITGHSLRNYGTDQSAKVTIGDTGTSFTAGQSMSSTDDKWQRQFGAEQRLFENVTVTGTVGVNGQGETNKSLTAGFKKSW